MKKEMNKKGQDLSIGTLILIVLGIVVLVILILGFSIGWTNLFQRIGIIGAGGVSLSDVATRCQLAATSDNTFDFCQRVDEIKADDNTVQYVTCEHPSIISGLESPITCPTVGGEKAQYSICKDLVEPDEVTAENKITFNNRQVGTIAECYAVFPFPVEEAPAGPPAP